MLDAPSSLYHCSLEDRDTHRNSPSSSPARTSQWGHWVAMSSHRTGCSLPAFVLPLKREGRYVHGKKKVIRRIWYQKQSFKVTRWFEMPLFEVSNFKHFDIFQDWSLPRQRLMEVCLIHKTGRRSRAVTHSRWAKKKTTRKGKKTPPAIISALLTERKPWGGLSYRRYGSSTSNSSWGSLQFCVRATGAACSACQCDQRCFCLWAGQRHLQNSSLNSW